MGLDGVELILGWEEAFGISISNEEAQAMLTPALAIDQIYSKVKSNKPADYACLAQRAFLRLRSAFRQHLCPTERILLSTKISTLLPGRNRREKLSAILVQLGLSPLPRLPFGLQFTATTVGDLVLNLLITDASRLRKPGHGWSRQQVRDVVRAVMTAQLNLKKFADSSQFRRDLGVD